METKYEIEEAGVKLTIEVTGLEDVINAFLALGKDAATSIKPTLERITTRVAMRAKQKVARISGDLADSISVTAARIKNDYVSSTVNVSVSDKKDGWYAAAVELGHKIVRHGDIFGAVKERPFLRPAADETKEEAYNMLIDAMNKEIDKQFGGGNE